jgi:hypothetical protein
MRKIIEVKIDESGKAQPVDPAQRIMPGRAFLVQSDPEFDIETMLLSEAALAANWLSPEEDAAWAHLQPVK